MKALTFYAADDYTQIVGTESLADIVAGASDVPVKIGIRNEGDEDFPTTISIGTVGLSDGASQMRLGADTDTLSPPWGVMASVSSPGDGGVWGATGEYGAVITALNALGETVASLEVTATVSDVTQRVTWSWTAVPTATGYNVYRRDPGGTYATPSLIDANESGTSFVDDGTAPGAGEPPIENTTAGPGPGYGTPPSLGLGPVTLGAAVVPGQRTYVWVGRVVPSGTTAQLNTRFGALDFA